MKNRRFSITKEQGDLVALALISFIEELNDRIETEEAIGNSTMYEKWRKAEAETLKKQLFEYNWEV